MTRWFRFYDDALNDPKVQRLDGDMFKHWVNILCLASKNEGRIPPVEDVAFALRVTVDGAETVLERLLDGGLIAPKSGGPNGSHYAPHNWSKRQYKSDSSTKRVKRYRERCKTVSETAPDTETDTETEKKNKERQAAYAFDGSVIKLTEPDFAKWERAYSHLDLRAELQTRDDWLANDGDASARKSWFIPTSNWLANRNRRAKAESEAARSPFPPGHSGIPI